MEGVGALCQRPLRWKISAFKSDYPSPWEVENLCEIYGVLAEEVPGLKK